MTSIPRLTIVGARVQDDPAPVVLGFARACREAGVGVAIAVVGADRESPDSDTVRGYAEVTGHAVQRLDPRLMSTPSIQRLIVRASVAVDLVIVVAHGGLEVPTRLSEFVDVQHALCSPIVICAKSARAEDDTWNEAPDPVDATRRIRKALRRHAPDGVPVPRTLPLDGVAEFEPLSAQTFETLLAFSDRPPALPPPVRHRRIGSRARIGLVLDECFDLYDEEGLVQLEVAGAELVPLPVMDRELAPEWDDELDGLLIGDGHIERCSVGLSRNRRARDRVRAVIGRGTPTIACGGGYAYLTRGLRTGGGALHPLAGVIDAEAVVTSGPLPRGHVEVATRRDSLIGDRNQRLRGYVQRTWLMRGTHAVGRAVYATLSGPPDEGYASGSVLAMHFRPYWPSCAPGIESFVDRCVSFAAAREFGMRGSACSNGAFGPARRRGTGRPDGEGQGPSRDEPEGGAA